MRTYFARHGSKLDIDADTYRHLWENGIVAVHYPVSKSGWSEESDATSVNPGDYTGAAKSALTRLQELARNGGYVCAVYEPYGQCLLGYVNPGSVVELITGKWGTKNRVHDRTAILKGVRLTRTLRLSPAESLRLLAARPRQGTFCRWSRIGAQVEQMVERSQSPSTVQHLTPTQQEVMCSEVLRLPVMRDFGLPRLETLLLPVGRTLKDVDFYGLDESGRYILAQVTNFEIASVQAKEKLERLSRYSGPESVLLLFCSADVVESKQGVRIVPLKLMFDVFTATDQGRRWLKLLFAVS